jgi:hypothetical protein
LGPRFGALGIEDEFPIVAMPPDPSVGLPRPLDGSELALDIAWPADVDRASAEPMVLNP